jgi:integrase
MNEIAALRWSEIDFDRGVISLPSERTKNHRPHEVPLGKTAQSTWPLGRKTMGGNLFLVKALVRSPVFHDARRR